MSIIFRIIVCSSLISMTVACGQKGPLFIPGEIGAAETIAEADESEAPENEDGEKSPQSTTEQ